MAMLIFDLDGTLVDTSSIFIPAVYQTLSYFPQVLTPSEEAIQKTFGLPDDLLWETLMPDTPAKVRQLACTFLSELLEKEMFKVNVLLPYAFDVLDQLHKRGHTLTTASNCGTSYLNAVLDSQHIRRFFAAPLCLGMVDGICKADILVQHLKGAAKNEVYMIGDRHSDIEAAHLCDIPAVGCKFGFGDDAELQDAEYVISSLQELVNLF